MTDPTPGLPRKQTKIGPKHFEDEPPRVPYSGRDDGIRMGGPRRGRMHVSHPPLDFKPTELTPAPEPEPVIFTQALFYALGIQGYKFTEEVPPMTMEQERIMDQVVWRLKNDD